jgi:uncharacterized protein
MKNIFCITFAVLLLSNPIWANYQEALQKKDYNTAFQELMPLAQKGDAKAQTILGKMYAMGQGVSQNQAEALKWFKKAAEKENAEAQFGIGVMYFKGQGVTQNYIEAMKWFKKAADHGHVRAQYNLGVIYYKGLSIPKNYIQAYMWWNVAALGGHPEAKKNLSVVAKNMTQAQIAEANKMASNWKPKK